MATFQASILGSDKSRAQRITRLGQRSAEATVQGWEYGLSLDAIKQESGRLLYHVTTNGGSNGNGNNRDISLEISTNAEGEEKVITLYYMGKLVDLDKLQALASVS